MQILRTYLEGDPSVFVDHDDVGNIIVTIDARLKCTEVTRSATILLDNLQMDEFELALGCGSCPIKPAEYCDRTHSQSFAPVDMNLPEELSPDRLDS